MNDFEHYISLILEKVQSFLEHPNGSRGLKEILKEIVEEIHIPSEILEQLPHDTVHPYSRLVLLNEPRLEVMMARWTPDIPCHPHDHGDAHSAILVLKGCSEHTRYQLKDGVLTSVLTEYKKTGDVILCGPHQIHSMKSYPDLITLHLYTTSIDNMLVFDMNTPSTYLLDGGCGAWLPVDDIQGVIAKIDGYVSRKSFQEEQR